MPYAVYCNNSFVLVLADHWMYLLSDGRIALEEDGGRSAAKLEARTRSGSPDHPLAKAAMLLVLKKRSTVTTKKNDDIDARRENNLEHDRLACEGPCRGAATSAFPRKPTAKHEYSIGS